MTRREVALLRAIEDAENDQKSFRSAGKVMATLAPILAAGIVGAAFRVSHDFDWWAVLIIVSSLGFLVNLGVFCVWWACLWGRDDSPAYDVLQARRAYEDYLTDQAER